MILVTGAAGFIGSNTVDRLLAEGHRVLGLDNFDPAYPRATKEANLHYARSRAGFSFAEVDIRDPLALTRALEAAPARPTSIIHLAARTGVRASMADPAGYHLTNFTGTKNLLEIARSLGVPRFILGSSSSVYGLNPRPPWREEDTALSPISPYAQSKLAAEAIGRETAATGGPRFIALRFFTVHGPRQRPDLAIARFAQAICRNQPVPRYGDGSSRRDYTYVGDIVDGIVRALDFQETSCEIINLGNHHTVSLQEMIEAVGQAFGRSPVIQAFPEQPGDVPSTWADITKAERLLGWRPKTDLLTGLRAYRDWLDSSA